MPVTPSTRQALDDHLGQAEFALTVARNFDCLQGTPAHDAVRVALAQVAAARAWVRESLTVASPAAGPVERAELTARERRRCVQQRMARLVP